MGLRLGSFPCSLNLLMDVEKGLLIEGYNRKRGPVIVFLLQLFELQGKLIFLSESDWHMLHHKLPNPDVHLIVLFLERVEPVAQDRVYLPGLEVL